LKVQILLDPFFFNAGAIGRTAANSLGIQAIHGLWTRRVRKSKKSKAIGSGREWNIGMRTSLPLFLIPLTLSIAKLPAQDSAHEMKNAQEGLADSSWPRKPGNQLSPLSGKMKDVKQIDPKGYAGGKEFKSNRVYEDRKESSMATVPMWARSSSAIKNKESSLSTHGNSSWDQSENSRFSQEANSTLQPKENLEQKEFAHKATDDWSSRISRTFQNEDGTRQIYQGRLNRVRERVSRDEPNTGRDLGEGKKEMFSPSEVKKILEGKPVPIDSLQDAPVKVPIKAESPMASLPSSAGN